MQLGAANRARHIFFGRRAAEQAVIQEITQQQSYVIILDGLNLDALKNRTFDVQHPRRAEFINLIKHRGLALRLSVFLLKNGYQELYTRILNGLMSGQFEFPEFVKNRLEEAFFTYLEEESNNQFMRDHEKRNRASSVERRMDEIITRYPLRLATTQHIADCPTCVICMENIRKRQHVRDLHDNCILHRKCADQWFIRNKNCPICRKVCIED